MGRWSRRTFLRVASQLSLVVGSGASIPALAAATPRYRVQRATPDDTLVLIQLFNDHLRSRACPYIDKIATWTSADAQDFLKLNNGTLILYRDDSPVGFLGLIDYGDPKTVSAVAPGADPSIDVIALTPDLLASHEAETAIKYLGAAASRELTRMGFQRCRMLLGPEPRPGADTWLSPHISKSTVRTVSGTPESREVTIVLSQTLAQLSAEGY